jgi:4-hydroxy-tetrahydrodipicolinate synthase
MKSPYQARHRDRFAGLWAAVHTPFALDGEVDEPGIRKNVRHYIEAAGLDGIFCNGLIGEIWALTPTERQRILEIILDSTNDELLVAAVTTHYSLTETIQLTCHAEQAGCHFAVLLNPANGPRSEEDLYRYFASICDRTGIDIVIFNTPLAGYSLSPALLARICDLPNVCGVKSTASLFENTKIREHCGDKCAISDPHEENYLHNLLSFNQRILFADPEPYLFQTDKKKPISEYMRRYESGDVAGFVREFQALSPLRHVHNKWVMNPLREGRMPNAAVKYWSEALGMAAGPVRVPLEPLTDGQRRELREDLTRVGLIEH